MMDIRPWTALVIDDDSLIHASMRMVMPDTWKIHSGFSIDDIGDRTYDAAFVDMHLKDKSRGPTGLEVVRELHHRDPHLEIVAISGDLDREIMEGALRAGASRFLAKPLATEEILMTLSKIEALLLLKDASHRNAAQSTRWIGSGQTSENIRKQVASLRGEAGPILIEGESGTGKEVIAQLLHQQEPDRPYITVNVSALPENLFESELFGHVKGAFTGADQNKMGLAEAAHGGDLFLDEIEALPPNLQPKFLRFLESGEIRRVGAKETIRLKVRIIASTNENLEKMVQAGKFREDLMYRLNGKRIQIPPLRERKEDIAELTEHFLKQERPFRNKSLSSDAALALQNHSWPGNVRELKRVVEQVSLHSPLPILRAEDVRSTLFSAQNGLAFPEADLFAGLDQLLKNYEKHVIALSIKKAADMEELVQILKISRSSLYKKIKDYGLPLGELK